MNKFLSGQDSPVTHPEIQKTDGAVPLLPGGAGTARRLPGMGVWLGLMRPRLLRLAYRMLWNVEDAEEVAQEALGTAWGRLTQLKDPGRRNAWLYRVVINLCRNRLRRRRRRHVAIEGAGVPVSVCVGGRIEQDELMERVRAAMGDLPARQREALILRDMEQLDYAAIAAILGTRSSAARLLVHRGRQGVRRILLRRWPESFDDLDR